MTRTRLGCMPWTACESIASPSADTTFLLMMMDPLEMRTGRNLLFHMQPICQLLHPSDRATTGQRANALPNDTVGLGRVVAEEARSSVSSLTDLEARDGRRSSKLDRKLNVASEVGGDAVRLLSGAGTSVLDVLRVVRTLIEDVNTGTRLASGASDQHEARDTYDLVRCDILALSLELGQRDGLPNDLLGLGVVMLEDEVDLSGDKHDSGATTTGDEISANKLS